MVNAELTERLGRIVGVSVQHRTYRNLAYLVLTLPLGTVYSLVFAVGLGLGLSMIPVLVGIPLSIASVLVLTRLASFERWLTNSLLDSSVPALPTDENSDTIGFERTANDQSGSWTAMTVTTPWTTHGLTLGDVVFLGVKQFVGVVVWLVLSVSLVLGVVLLLSPLHYQNPYIGIHFADELSFVPRLGYQHGLWEIDVIVPFFITIPNGELVANYLRSTGTLLEPVVAGVVITVASLHLINGMAWVNARLAERLLGTRSSTDR